VEACPVLRVAAPPAVVRRTLGQHAAWVDGRVLAVEPPGALRAGQRLRVAYGPFAVDLRATAARDGEVRPQSRLPFGLASAHDIRMDPMEDGHTLLTFG